MSTSTLKWAEKTGAQTAVTVKREQQKLKLEIDYVVRGGLREMVVKLNGEILPGVRFAELMLPVYGAPIVRLQRTTTKGLVEKSELFVITDANSFQGILEATGVIQEV